MESARTATTHLAKLTIDRSVVNTQLTRIFLIFFYQMFCDDHKHARRSVAHVLLYVYGRLGLALQRKGISTRGGGFNKRPRSPLGPQPISTFPPRLRTHCVANWCAWYVFLPRGTYLRIYPRLHHIVWHPDEPVLQWTQIAVCCTVASLIDRMGMACLPYPVRWHGIAFYLLRLLHNFVEYLCLVVSERCSL